MPTREQYYTQWAAQFYVAAELTRRRYLVSLTLGNARSTDLIVASPKETSFNIQVESMATHNFWIVPGRKPSPSFYYIPVYVSRKDAAEHPRFFIHKSDEIMEEKRKHREQKLQNHSWKQYAKSKKNSSH